MNTRIAFVSACFLSLYVLLNARASWGDEAGTSADDGTEASADASGGTDASRRLDAFMRDVDNFSADFEQTLYDADSEPLQSSSGTVVLMRPGRFDWRYTDPVGQTIVADGKRVWLYDPDLEQVTVNPIDERVAGTPLVVLMGTEPLDTAFDITPLGPSEGIDWLELVPKTDGADFESVYIGFNGDDLAALELRDSFGQATQIRFTNFEANGDVDEARFDFEPPEGVDVIGLEQ